MMRSFFAWALLAALVSVVFVPARASSPSPRTGHYTSHGATLAYELYGSGSAIWVLLAGGPGYEPTYIRTVVPLIAAPNRTVILLHQRGTGLSRSAVSDAAMLDVAGEVADLEALRVALHEPALRLVGHSWGGYLGLAYAARHPSTVRALILLDAGGNDVRSWLPITPSMLAKLEPRERRKARLACASMRPSEACDQAELPTLFYAPARIPQFVAPMAKDKVFDHVDVNDRVTFDIVLEPHLTVLNGPCPPSLIVYGAADPYGDPGIREVGHLVPCARKAIIPRAGHFTWFERPDGFRQIVRPFMAANDTLDAARSAAK